MGELFGLLTLIAAINIYSSNKVADVNIFLLKKNSDFFNYRACDQFNRTKLLLTQV